MKKEPTNILAIEAYLHCGKCLDELDKGEIDASPKEYQQIQVGWTVEGLQIWCLRHNCNVVHIDFEGKTHPANTTAFEKPNYAIN